MAMNSKIEWTNHTFNGWWGCVKVSPGCDHCYANTWANRMGHNVWGPHAQRRILSDAQYRLPLAWDKKAQEAGERHKVFCSSMADFFENRPDLIEPRNRILKLIKETTHLDWQVLTKRPQNIRKHLPKEYDYPPNLWLGTSVEDQHAADTRIRFLLKHDRAAVRFLSCEPLLGPVDIRRYLVPNSKGAKIDWVIIGGEAGGHSRPMNPIWAASLIRQCEEAGVAVFFKQWGDYLPRKRVQDEGKRYRMIPVFKSNGDEIRMVRVGKAAAGATIFGQEWREFPNA
jgi:protein gp37